MMMVALRLLFVLLIVSAGCGSSSRMRNQSSEPAGTAGPSVKLPLERLRLPEGFQVAIYAEVPNARSMALGEKGTLFCRQPQ